MILGSQGNLQSLTGGLRLKVRIQHPGVHERTDRGGSYWFFRYWEEDVLQQNGTTKAIRKFHTLGLSKGDNKLSKKQAEITRDKFLAKINKPTIQEKVADGLVLFSKMVEKYRAAHVDAEAAGRFLLAKPTRDKYIIHLEQRIVPKWGERRLCEISPDQVQQWLFETCDSWHMMNDLRGIMSGIYTKAEEWGYWPEGRRNPISRVKIGEKWSVRPERILTEEETVKVLARLSDPNLLVLETAIATGARISEILGLKWCHIDLSSRPRAVRSALFGPIPRIRRMAAYASSPTPETTATHPSAGTRRGTFRSWLRASTTAARAASSAVSRCSRSPTTRRASASSGMGRSNNPAAAFSASTLRTASSIRAIGIFPSRAARRMEFPGQLNLRQL